MSNMSQFFAGGGIKRVQRGTHNPDNISASSNVTIPIAVDPDKAFLYFSWRSDTTGSNSSNRWTGRITSATNINFSRYTAQGFAHTIEWQVVEFN